MKYKNVFEGEVIKGPWGHREVGGPKVVRTQYDQRDAKPRPVSVDSSVRFYPAGKYVLGGWYYRHTDGQMYGPHATYDEAVSAQDHHRMRDEASARDGKDYW